MTGEKAMDISAYWDGSELDLSCSLEGLRQLIGVLRRNELGTYRLETNIVGYVTNILTLDIESTLSKLVITIADQKGLVSGNLPSLLLLTENLEFLCSQRLSRNDQHLHLEPASNDFLFSQQSEALIISRRS
jgi:hypothetical protein